MTRGRMVLLAVIGVLCFVVAAGYFVYARSAVTAPAAATPVPTIAVAAALAAPHLVFRNSALGADYGKLALVPLADPAGPRAVVGDVSCARVYAAPRAGVCVTASRGMTPSYGVSMLDDALRPTTSTVLTGEPSRARMSADGRLVSTTTFVTGHSYASTSFSTSTIIREDGRALGNLETWRTTLPDGSDLRALNRNFWGVTFAADDDTFYATAASGSTTWLVRGSIRARTMTALRTDAECPSLSPDGTHVAYKKRLGNATPGVWRLAVLDLATSRETLLAETRSVDDQVEWLDRSSVLYALPRTGTEATTTDVWEVPADGLGTPTVLVPQASSPAVVR
ncbi:hypothetical protein [uncultured Friedmanniella sp.]|uniref:hypothetical protein n=1 Tax=uncultured Friedmanniella sp. TaxID=335381 RepID=UPI0035CADA57